MAGTREYKGRSPSRGGKCSWRLVTHIILTDIASLWLNSAKSMLRVLDRLGLRYANTNSVNVDAKSGTDRPTELNGSATLWQCVCDQVSVSLQTC